MGFFLPLDPPNKYVDIDGMATGAGGREIAPTPNSPTVVLVVLYYSCIIFVAQGGQRW
jgi:hypothetical protein